MVKTKIKAYTKLTVIFLIGDLYGHLATIFTSDCRRSRPLDKIRNFEKKKLLVGCLLDPFGGRGWMLTWGPAREFLIFSDVNCLVGLEGGSTIKKLFFFYF